MKNDQRKAANANGKLTVGDAREQTIKFLTEHWEQSLVTLAHKLMGQGFSQEETLELCESFRPMFEKNMADALLQFDRDADEFIALCRFSGAGNG